MKKRSTLIIAVLLIFFNIIIHSEEDYNKLFDDIESKNTENGKNEPINNDFVIPVFEFSLLGDHSFEFHAPITKDHLDFYGNVKAPRFSNDLGMELKYKILSVIIHWQIDIVLNDFSSVYNILKVQPLENSIKWSPWKFNFGVGMQYFSWGVADGMNPTDNLNPNDYSRGIEAVKLPVLSAYTGFYPLDFLALEVIYIPFEQNDIFPEDVEDELPGEIFDGVALNYTSGNPMDPSTWETSKKTEDMFKDTEKSNLRFDPASFVLGGKISFFMQYADFSFSYIYDVDPFYTPILYLKKNDIYIHDHPFLGTVDSGKDLYRVEEIDLVRKRLHRFGTDFKTTVDKFGLWFEVCYTMSEDYLNDSYKIRNHKLNWITGFDFNYGPNNDFYVNIQYFGEFIPAFDDDFYREYEDGEPNEDKVGDKKYMEEFYYRALTDNLGGYRAGLTQGLIVKMEWPLLNSLLTPSFTAIYALPLVYDYDHEIKYGSLAINPEFDIMPVDSFHIVLGADLCFSWKKETGENLDIDYDDMIGYFYYHNNIYIEVKYKWNFDWRK